MATIAYLAEQALADHLNSLNLSATAVTGRATAAKDAPLIVCTAVEWLEDEINLNWYRIRCTVETKALASAGVDAFDDLCVEVRDGLRFTDLGTSLNEAQPLLVFASGAISSQDKGEFSVSEDVLVETRELELFCAMV